ncbi:MAG: hypothetical protein QM535_10545 [Limnohabitans sp.]|nr:hypothetical protein [Limnohabitans sp.]
MNTKAKKLIEDVLSFLSTRKFKGDKDCIKKAYDKLGRDIVFYRLSDIITLIDPISHLKDTDLEKYHIYDEEIMDDERFAVVHKEFELLFHHLPELNEVFLLTDKYVKFNPNISKEDIQEMYKLAIADRRAHPHHYHFLRKP